MSLSQKDCVPCRGGVPPLSPAEAARFAAEVPAWSVVDNHHVTRTFPFSDWASAVAWVNRVAALADQVGHHPDVHLSWGRVRIDIWTHKIDGLTESDFILAAKCDALFETP